MRTEAVRAEVRSDLDLRNEADDPRPEKIHDQVRILAEIHPEPGPAPVLGTRVLAEDLAPVPAEIIFKILYLQFRGEIDQANSKSRNKLGDLI